MASFGSTLLVTGPESFLAQRAVARTRTAALAERPDADVNEITATEPFMGGTTVYMTKVL